MKYRTFGRMGWQVSEVGYGMWGMGGWTGSNDEESRQSLRLAVEKGVNFFDTAWIYGNGHSETLLGELIRHYPQKKLYVSTKIPPKNLKWPMEPFYSLDDTYPTDHIIEYIEKSLRNLGVETLDIVHFHGWDDAWADDERWQKAVVNLKQRGLIQAVGISIDRWEPENAIKAIKTGLIDTVELIYNIFDQAPEDVILPVCHKANVAVIARVPFDEGSLTGKLTVSSHWPEGDWRNLYFGPENLPPTLERIGKLKKIIPAGISLPELALQFILSNPHISTTIPGMRRTEHVVSNCAVSEKGTLDAQLLTQLRAFRWDRKPTSWAG